MSRWLFIVALPALIFISFSARAEYRAFQLLITDTTSGKTRTVVSTLDDIQYPAYHPLRRSEKIVIQDTWMCWLRSDEFQPICSNPRAPASLTAAPVAGDTSPLTSSSPAATGASAGH